jgi:hypothetical protein
MVAISVKHNFENTLRLLETGVRRQVPFAIKNTLNKLAESTKQDAVAEMRRNFDSPTPFTLNSLFIKYATKQKLAARVFVKDRELFKSKPFNEHLAHQFSGGVRIKKRLEFWFMRAGFISAGEFLVPGAGALLDSYGNMSRGQIQKVLSQLRTGPDASAYQTKSKRSRSKRIDVGYFWSRGGKLKRGVWARYKLGFGSAVKPVLLVVNRVSYRQRIDLQRIAQVRVDRDFNRLFAVEMQKAIATAR